MRKGACAEVGQRTAHTKAGAERRGEAGGWTTRTTGGLAGGGWRLSYRDVI